MKQLFILTILLTFVSCSEKVFKEKWTEEEAPEYFKARFETTEGNFDIEAKREWSPKGVDRLYQLIDNEFYTDMAIFRVVPDFIAQFGIHNDSLVNQGWNGVGVEDEPNIVSNTKGTISFARSGPKTRTSQIFVNLKDNSRLDNIDFSGVKGFPVVAKVISGLDVVEKFHSGYGDELGRKQDSIHKRGNAFIKEKYPAVDFIYKAYIIK